MRAASEDVVQLAVRWSGTPYRHQASARGQGADCLGLLRGVWRDLGHQEPTPVPPYTPGWHHRTRTEPLADAARLWLLPPAEDAPRPGDALFFRMHRNGPVKHCGIMLPGDRFLHAYEGRAVIATRWSRWWQVRLIAHYSFPAPKGPTHD